MPTDAIALGLLGAQPLSESVYGLTSEVNQSQTNNGLGIGDDTFLKLLIAQLQNQDPLSPMDSQELMNQVATLTMLEQTIQMNQNLEDYLSQQPLLQASQFIGKSVQAILEDGTPIEGEVESVQQSGHLITLNVQGYGVPLELVTKVYETETGT